MDSNTIYYRRNERKCYCRLCDKDIEKDTENIIIFKTWRGQGTTTILCEKCAKAIGIIVGNNVTPFVAKCRTD